MSSGRPASSAARIAIVHDYLVQYGGAERVIEALHELWPSAPIYTSMYEPTSVPPVFAEMDIRTSFMQRVPLLPRRWKLGLPLYASAMRSFDLSGYDIVVSSTSAWAHGARVDPPTPHLVYCYTPPRWLHRSQSYRLFERIVAAPLRAPLRRWDRRSARRATLYVGISSVVQARIRSHYGRDARVLHPPVETERFSPAAETDDFYLCAARLLPYKRIDLAIAACERSGRRLLVAGDGSARPALERMAGPHTTFLGHVSDDELARLLARCRALIVPAEEDFCISAVEAMASGRPVVAYARGGVLDTVVPGSTGVLFQRQSIDDLVDALERLESMRVASAAIHAYAERFDRRAFQAGMQALVDELLTVSEGGS